MYFRVIPENTSQKHKVVSSWIPSSRLYEIYNSLETFPLPLSAKFMYENFAFIFKKRDTWEIKYATLFIFMNFNINFQSMFLCMAGESNIVLNPSITSRIITLM